MKGEKVVYFVRHGQSVANVSAVFQPPHSPLSEEGWEQARCIGRRMAQLSCAALISSPFRRAVETAHAIAQQTALEAEYSELFVERIKPSSINGAPIEDEVAQATWRRWEESLYTPSMRVEDGENFDDIIARADRALVFLGERNEASLAVVTHGFFLRTLVARALFTDMLNEKAFKRFQSMASMENTGLTVLRWRGETGWRLWIYNDHAHLG
jgi:2,3-bisphosphoglycerate-dependent phosphoglycerate mutase